MSQALEIVLHQMDETAYEQFTNQLRTRYVQDRIQSNLFSEQEAIDFTQQQWASILPSGISTPGHFFLHAFTSNTEPAVGSAWLYVDETHLSSFIYELFLEPVARGKGLGRATLQALQDLALANQARTLGLNVFATNETAKSLYRSFGFSEVSTDMIKPISASVAL